MWKTTDFPAAKKGYLWSIILQVLLGKLNHIVQVPLLCLQELSVIVTAVIQYLLWRDKKKAARAKAENEYPVSQDDQSQSLEASEVEKKVVVHDKEVSL